MHQDSQNLRFEGGPASSNDEEDASSSSSSSSPCSRSNEQAFSHSCNIRRKGFKSENSQTTNSHIACYSSITRSAADSLEKPKCGRCNEVFSSMKALYVHMRFHLEAPWKACISSLNDACWSWSVTGRRGRIRTRVEKFEVSLMNFAQTGNSTTSSLNIVKKKDN